jgi:hypothetical protein
MTVRCDAGRRDAGILSNGRSLYRHCGAMALITGFLAGPLRRASRMHCRRLRHRRVQRFSAAAMKRLSEKRCSGPNILGSRRVTDATQPSSQLVLFFRPPVGQASIDTSYPLGVLLRLATAFLRPNGAPSVRPEFGDIGLELGGDIVFRVPRARVRFWVNSARPFCDRRVSACLRISGLPAISRAPFAFSKKSSPRFEPGRVVRGVTGSRFSASRYISFLLNWSAKYSACRIASATMVSVGFSAPPLVNWLPSEMNRFGMS